MIFCREKTRYVTCRISSCILGLIPTVTVMMISVIRLMVYSGIDVSLICHLPTKCYWIGSEGVTFHLIIAIAGMVFCTINTAINIIFFCIQSKVVLWSWITWTFLGIVGHIIVSFEQSIMGPLEWFEGGVLNILQIIYQLVILICWSAVVLVSFGKRLDMSKDHRFTGENIPLQQIQVFSEDNSL